MLASLIYLLFTVLFYALLTAEGYQWILGRALQLYPNNNGTVRSAKVQSNSDWESGPLLRSLYSVNQLPSLELGVIYGYEVPVLDVLCYEYRRRQNLTRIYQSGRCCGGGGGPTDSQVSLDSSDAVWEPNIVVAGSSCPWGEMGPQAKYSDLDHLIEGGGILSSPSAEESLSLG